MLYRACLATASCGISLIKILEIDKSLQQKIFDSSYHLINSCGKFTVLNYDELLAEILQQNRESSFIEKESKA